MLPHLRQFWKTFQTKLADKEFYKASIGGMRLRLAELQKSEAEAQKIRAKELKEGLGKYLDIERLLHYQGLPFLPEII